MNDKSYLSLNILSAIGESYALLDGSKNVKEAINRILPMLGEASDVDRVYVFRNYYDSNGVFCITYLNEWCRAGINAQMNNDQLVGVPWDVFPELEIELRNNQVQNKLVKDSPNELFKEIMSQQDIVAYLFIPILVNNNFWGFIGFDNCTREEIFTSEQVSALHAFATTLGNLIFAKISLKKVLKSQQRYKQIIGNVRDVIFKLDQNLNITYLDGAWTKITGREIWDCLGQPLPNFLAEDSSKKLIKEILEIQNKPDLEHSFLAEIKKFDSEFYHVRINIKQNQKKEWVEYFGTINDVNQNQINFQLLKESEAKFKSLFDSVEDILYSLDATTCRLLMISEKVEQFGRPKEYFFSNPRNWWNLIIPEDRLKVRQGFRKFLKNKHAVFQMEYRIMLPDGNIVWIYDKAGLECNSEGKVVRIHGQISDVTDKKDKEIQLEQTENRFRIITEHLPFPFILSADEDFKLIYYNYSFDKVFDVRLGNKPSFGVSWVSKLVTRELNEVFVKFCRENPNFSDFEIQLNTTEGLQWFSISSQSIPYKMGIARAVVFYNINKRKLSELEMIRMNDVIQAINQTHIDFSIDGEIRDTFYILLKNLINFTNSTFGFLAEVLLDDDNLPYLKTNAISNISWNDEAEDYYQKNFHGGMEFRNLDSLFGWVLKNKKVLISNDVANDSRRSPHATPVGHPILQRFLGIPIFKGDRFIGMVGLANKEKPYSQEDVDFLKPFLSSYANLIASLNVNKEKRIAEGLQKESESLYRLLSENIDDIVSLHDLDLKTVYASPSIEKVTGFHPNQFIGKDFFNFFAFNPGQGVDFAGFPRFIIPLIHGVSGKEIKLEMLWKLIYGENGIVTSYLAASRDVTKREQVLKELKKMLEKEIDLNQLKSKFISMTSHELRTPLATIQSSADLMEIYLESLDEGKTKDGFKKQIDKIHFQLSRLIQIISDVLLFERNNEGKLNFNASELDLKNLITQLIANQFVSTEGEPKIDLHLGEFPIFLKSDSTLLFHVLRNLIENSLKYTPQGSPRPILKVIPKGDVLVISVQDFGIGIPKEETKFVYETFFRASNVKNIKGTGLGLSIVHDLVQKLGGKLTFTSKENLGSTFTIILPYE